MTAPTKCIYCGSQNISADEFEEVDNVEATRKVACLHCHRWWWEVYAFNHAEYPDNTLVERR